MQNTCANCGEKLKGGEYTPKWSEGNNKDSSVRCPHCGFVNYQWDDDDDDD